MQDDVLEQPLPVPRQRRIGRIVVLVAALAFALGGAVVGWLVKNGQLPYALPPGAARALAGSQPIAAKPAPARAAPDAGATLTTVETRLAMIEDRLSRVDVQTNAASGNAARAEALLVALAARRAIDRGEPLGYLETQLKLRFANAQPQAVQTIIAAAKAPVTIDELSGMLEAAAPVLAGATPDESGWTRIRRELANLFVVRRASGPAATAQDRVARARLMLAAGKIDDAIDEVERLPGAHDAQTWIEAARRYGDVQQALDLIETAAMLEPHRLQDSIGKTVEQPSPLASPAAGSPVAGPPALVP